MSLLEAISMGAAMGAVGAACHLARALGEHGQRLADHDRRLAALEQNYQTIAAALHELKELITSGGA